LELETSGKVTLLVILNGAKRSEESGILAAMIFNLLLIITAAGKTLPPKTRFFGRSASSE